MPTRRKSKGVKKHRRQTQHGREVRSCVKREIAKMIAQGWRVGQGQWYLGIERRPIYYPQQKCRGGKPTK